MLNKISHYKKTLCFALGALAASALPPFYLFPVLFICFSALLLIINQSASWKQAFKYAYIFGFAFFAASLSWIGNALLIDARTFGWLYPIVILACGGFFGLFYAFPAALSFYFKNIYARYLSFAAFFVLFEWIRSFIFTGFPWNLLGSVLAFSTLTMQPASLIGTYGLSYLVLMVTSAPALYFACRTRRSLVLGIVLPLFFIAFIIAFGSYKLSAYQDTSSSPVTIRLVQPNIPQTMKWDKASLQQNFNEYINLSASKSLDNIDFVIWGETASPYPLDLDDTHRRQLQAAIPPQGYLITGLVRYENDYYGNYQALNSMLVINSDSLIEDYYDKSHLVPFGEYIPLRSYLPNWIRPVANAIGTFKPGTGPKIINIADYPSFGGLICYEVIFPRQIINPQHRPDWIVNLTNDGWYGDSQGPYQHLVSTQLRAVEEGISIVRSANTGISALINPLGEVLGQIPLNRKGILDVKLPHELNFSTAYSKYGNILPLILVFVNIVLAFYLSSRSL